MSDIDDRILALLRMDPEPLVPLARIHRTLQDDFGPGPRELDRLRERVRRRPDLFILLETRHPALDASWSPELRLEYEAALIAAGFDPGPRVALAAGPDSGDGAPAAHHTEFTLQRMDATLLGLWHANAADATAREDILDAMREAGELRRALRPHAID